MNYLPHPRTERDFKNPPTAAEIRSLAARMLGAHAEIAEARELGNGAFNNAFRLTATDGRSWVLRVSPQVDHPHLFCVERFLLRREHALTPWLAAVAPLLPRVVATDFTNEVLPRDAVVSDFIDAENWHEVSKQLTEAENNALWRELAGLMRRIHATPAPHFGWTVPEPPHATWRNFVLGVIEDLLRDLDKFHVEAADARAWFAVAQRGADALDEIRDPRVVHGDPWPKNVLIRRDPDGEGPRIVALIDHERGLFGDPLQEWVFHGYHFPPPFWEVYGERPNDPPARLRAAFYRGMINIQCLLEGPRHHWEPRSQRAGLVKDQEEIRILIAALR